MFERAAGRFATFGVHAAELNALTGAAELQLALLEPDAALALDSRVRELIEQVSDPARKRSGELTRVELLAANGRMQEAASLLERTLDAAAQANDRAALARGHILAARIAMARGDARLAATEAEAALQRLTAADDSRERARTLRLHVQALLALGDIGAAKQAVAALSDFAASDGTAPSKLYFHLATAAVAAASGEASANEVYAQALGEADALRIPLDLREVASEYSAWLVRSGDLRAPVRPPSALPAGPRAITTARSYSCACSARWAIRISGAARWSALAHWRASARFRLSCSSPRRADGIRIRSFSVVEAFASRASTPSRRWRRSSTCGMSADAKQTRT